MRKALDFTYLAAMYVSGVCMVGVLLAVMSNVAGRSFGFQVSGADAYAGYLAAASAFFALAHTLKRGEHIRVSIVLARARGMARKLLELWCFSAGIVICIALAVYSWRLVWLSWLFGDISQSNDATPLWIPQLSMALGCSVMLLAMLDLAVSYIRNKGAEPPEQLPIAKVE